MDVGANMGTAVTYQWQCLQPQSSFPWQYWDIIPYDSTWHFIKNKYSNLCLDVQYQNPADGATIWQYPCNYGPAQKFTFPAAGAWGEIRNLSTNKCVDLKYSGVGDGTPIWQYTCNGGRAQQWYADNHSPEKRLYTDRWYQFFEDSYNYTTWMTLSTHRHVASNYAANWNSPISGALADWNNYAIAPNTVYLSEISPPDPEHDVHIVVTSNCYGDFGVYKCTLDNLGVTYLFDELKHECQTPDLSVGGRLRWPA